MSELLRQIAKFASVGMIATALHIAVAMTVHYGAGLTALRANFAAFCVATLWSYCGNWAWTFGRRAKVTSSAPRFFAMSLAAFALNQGIVFWLTSVQGLSLAAALVPVAAIVPAFSFWLSRSHIFATRHAVS